MPSSARSAGPASPAPAAPRPPRGAGPPLAWQILGLLLVAIVVAQLVTLLMTLLLPPAPPRQYELRDIARVLAGTDEGKGTALQLERYSQANPPSPGGPGWLTPEHSRRELAQMLGQPLESVRLFFYTPLPFAGLAGVPVPPPPPATERGSGLSVPETPLLRSAFLRVQASGAAGPGGTRGARGPGQGGPGTAGNSGDAGRNDRGQGPRGGGPGAEGPRGIGGPEGSGVPGRRAAESPSPPGATTTGDTPTAGIGSTPGRETPQAAPPAPRTAGPAAPDTVAPALRAAPPAGVAATPPGRGTTKGATEVPPAVVPKAAVPAASDTAAATRSATADPESGPLAPAPRSHVAQPPAPALPPTPSTANAPTPALPPDAARPDTPPAAADRLAANTRAQPPQADPRTGLFGLAPEPFVQGDFVAAVYLSDAGWTTVQPRPEGFPNAWQRRVLLWFAVAVVLVAPLAWWFSRRLVRPLGAFAQAAEQLGRHPTTTVLAQEGPAELGRAAQAFNRMQNRLHSFVEDRTAMVGAISHDLRTPLTRMRFRVEDLPEDAEEARTGLLRDMDEMEQMIRSVLLFLRDAGQAGTRETLDLASLVQDVVEDAVFVGHPATMATSTPALVDVDAIALRRVLSNLVENAVKYGSNARLRLHGTRDEAVVEVQDEGPGIDDAELEQVFQPFYRTRAAQSAGAAGHGLGLAVCRSIARAHGGDVRLRNAPEGGLVAELRLPLAPVRGQ